MVFLLALGNSGSDMALETFVRYLKDTAAELRAAAADGLRWLTSGEADVHLRHVLLEDPEPSVRIEAAFALSFRKSEAGTFQATKRAFLNDRSVPVRLSALRNLWEMRQVFPEVNDLVKDAASQDRSGDIRKAAAQLLGLPAGTIK
jgi:HEAT repeat protein